MSVHYALEPIMDKNLMRFSPAYLYFIVQDDLAQDLQGDDPLHLEAPFQVEQGDLLGVSGVGRGVDVGQGLEVVVDGVAHHHFAMEQLCHLTNGYRTLGQSQTIENHLLIVTQPWE